MSTTTSYCTQPREKPAMFIKQNLESENTTGQKKRDKEMEIDSRLVNMCIDAATASSDAVDKWRLQRRSLHRLPSPLAAALFHRLLRRRLLFPSLLQVFKSSVEEVDLSGENYVDAEWMAYLGAFSYLRSLNVSDCYRINNFALWPLAGMTSLKELDLSRCSKVTDAGVNHILSISLLEKLNLSHTGVTAAGVKLLSALQNISTLDLGGLPVTDMALSSLQELTNLEYLDVWGSKLSDEGAAALKNFSKLRFLNLTWTNITQLPNLKSVEYLNMSDCTIHCVMEGRIDHAILRKLILNGSSFPEADSVFSSIETSGLSFLSLSNSSLSYFGFLYRMNALEHLDLSFCTIEDAAVEAIASIGANLRYLNLNNTKISTISLEILAGHVPKLEVLSLSHTSIDDIAFVYISMMTSLKTLSLSNTKIKGFIHQSSIEDEVLSLVALKDVKHLKILDLEMTQVTDEAVRVLVDFEELSHLSLNSTLLTDKCLEHLSQVKNLVNLSIQGTLLTNGALELFDPPITLEVLDLRGCWLLTVDPLALFCKKNPFIRVRHDHISQSLEDHNSNATPSQKGLKVLKQKQRDGKSSESPITIKRDIIDQRIKYDREELLSFQHLPTSLVPPSTIDIAVLKMD